MMNRDNVIDLLTIISATDNREVDEASIALWATMIGAFDEDEAIDAIMAHFRDCPGVWIEPGHVLARMRAARRDRLSRMDPDERAQAVGKPGVRRDKDGYVDKTAPDEPDYPADWTAEQRTAAYWDKVQKFRDQREYEDAIAGRPGALFNAPPASQATRAAALAAFANRNLDLDDGEEGPGYVNVRLVKCPFCQASVGEPCTKPGMPGKPREKLTDIAGHPLRITAAALAQGYSQEQAEELAMGATMRQAVRVRTAWLPGDAPPAPPEQRREVNVEPVDVSAQRGEQISASRDSTPPPQEPPPDEIPGGGWRDKAGRVRFPDTDALDRAWSQRQDTLFGGDQ